MRHVFALLLCLLLVPYVGCGGGGDKKPPPGQMDTVADPSAMLKTAPGRPGGPDGPKAPAEEPAAPEKEQ